MDEGANELSKALGIWPHQARGEGHFLALFRKIGGGKSSALSEDRKPIDLKNIGRGLPKQEFQIVFDFFHQQVTGSFLNNSLDATWLSIIDHHLYQIPRIFPEQSGIRTVRPWWWLGTLKTGRERSSLRFIPSYDLAMSLRLCEGQHVLNLPAHDSRLQSYLRGETISADQQDGLILIGVDGFSLGWGKVVSRRIKNFYPRGLRFN